MAEAAGVLGISAEAVRGRIRRKTLPVEREGGTVYVLLEGVAEDRTTGDPTRTTDDRTDALIDELRDRVRSLEEANSENRRIIAALTSRIPAMEAPSDVPGSTETVEQEPEGDQPRPDAPGAQAGAQRQTWWRRLIGR